MPKLDAKTLPAATPAEVPKCSSVVYIIVKRCVKSEAKITNEVCLMHIHTIFPASMPFKTWPGRK